MNCNIYASESFLNLVGQTQQQCSDFGWGDVLHPEDAERTIAAWKECIRTEGTWRKLRSTQSREHQLQPINLKDIILGIKEQFSNVNGRHITINYTTVESRVLATSLVKDVFINIVGNAIKHSDPDMPLGIFS